MVVYKIKESYRVSRIRECQLGPFRRTTGWKSQIDFDAGIHPYSLPQL